MLEEALKCYKGKTGLQREKMGGESGSIETCNVWEECNHGDASEITGNHGELISGRVLARNRRVGELEGKKNESELELNRRMCFLEEKHQKAGER